MNIEREIERIEALLEPYRLPFVELKPEPKNSESPWSSKFGGKPYWPKGMDYPKDNDGKPLFLLAQLNFDELPIIKDYPASGILQFFIADDDLYGMDFDRPINDVIDNHDTYRVVYHASVEKDIKQLTNDLPEVSENETLPLAREFCLTSESKTELASVTDYRFEKHVANPFELDDELWDELSEVNSAEGSKIGGYANFTQEDPRSDEPDEWLLLFQLDSDFFEDDEIMWGDMGVANFFIQKSELENKDFSRVWYNWDCS